MDKSEVKFDSIEDLDIRLSRGDSYLAAHPDDATALALYRRLSDQYWQLALAEWKTAEGEMLDNGY